MTVTTTRACIILEGSGVCVDGHEAQAMRHDFILENLVNCYNLRQGREKRFGPDN